MVYWDIWYTLILYINSLYRRKGKFKVMNKEKVTIKKR